MAQPVLLAVLGAALIAAGAWWLWAGRWRWLPAAGFHRRASEPTRMVVALVHMIVGYHLIVWQLPAEFRPPHIDAAQWPWVLLAGAALTAASLGLDAMERHADRGDHPGP